MVAGYETKGVRLRKSIKTLHIDSLIQQIFMERLLCAGHKLCLIKSICYYGYY